MGRVTVLGRTRCDPQISRRRPGADINMDQKPLHAAVNGRFGDIVEFLLTRGARQDGRDAFRYTPLEWAHQMDYADIAAELQRR